MAAPEGYTELAIVGIAWKGEYQGGTPYYKMNAVTYNGSSYVALIDSPAGTPTNDKVNWQYLARGFDDNVFEQEGEIDEESN